MYYFSKKRAIELLEYFSVAGIIISSGTKFFSVYHGIATQLCWFVSCLLLLFIKKRVNKNLLVEGGIIISILTFILLINYNREMDYQFYFSLLLRIICIVILFSNMNIKVFEAKFVDIIILESIMSLICFFLVVIMGVDTLPLQFSYTEQKLGGYDVITLTPYYTIGALSSGGNYVRNSGMFIEAPMHQFFLNIALLFLIYRIRTLLSDRRFKIYFVIICITVLTTKSTAGYLCLILIIFSILFKKQLSRNELIIRIGIFLGILIFIYCICVFGGVFDKLLYGSGSFVTRLADTIGTFRMSFKHPIFGTGFYTDVSLFSKYGVETRSNGLLNLVIQFGYPLTILYLFLISKNIGFYFKNDTIFKIIFMLIILITLSTEPIGTYPVLICFIFRGRRENNEYNIVDYSNNMSS